MTEESKKNVCTFRNVNNEDEERRERLRSVKVPGRYRSWDQILRLPCDGKGTYPKENVAQFMETTLGLEISVP